jgi:hypothetical protein
VKYRFGFNSMERVDETYGAVGTSYDFGARMFDARIGRWFSLDAQADKYPDISPFAGMADNPIITIDIDGNVLKISSNSSPEFRERVLCTLQLLTNRQLQIDANGVITEVHNEIANSECELPVGSSLISELIDHNRTLTIEELEAPADISSNVKPACKTAGGQADWVYAADGTGDDAVANINFANDPLLWIIDPNTGCANQERGLPSEILLAHELIHGLNIFNGKSEAVRLMPDGRWIINTNYMPRPFDACNAVIPQTEIASPEEYNVTGLDPEGPCAITCGTTENGVREEQGTALRGAYEAEK